ncbi:hypothetical protein RRG08_015487 [Elysia crispata]|uniref:Apple domain-containing protein n=1 Tax=Elysia crispata TaxID=231223 RepID=A0AAE1A5M4_9GAST|nr:hypothetical protein RRG08_015487 [Elysia crispata]
MIRGTNASNITVGNLGECARRCLALNASCSSIAYRENTINPVDGDYCGLEQSTLGPSGEQDLEVYVKETNNTNASAITQDPECETFVFVQSGSSKSFSSPLSLNSAGQCRIVLVTDENSTLTLTAQFDCNMHCSCSDLLSIHNSGLNDTVGVAVTACLDASENQTELVVTSAEGGFLVLELLKDVASMASYDVTVESWQSGLNDSLALVRSDLFKDSSSGLQDFHCYRSKNYVPSCIRDPQNTTSPNDPVGLQVNQSTQEPDNNFVDNAKDNNNNDGKTSNDVNTSITEVHNNNNNSSNNDKSNNTNGYFDKEEYVGESSGVDAAVVAGAAVGGILGLLLLGAVIYVVYWRCSHSKVHPRSDNDPEHDLTTSSSGSTKAGRTDETTTAT